MPSAPLVASIAALLAAALPGSRPQEGPQPDDAGAGLEAAFEAQGVRVDLERGLCSIPVDVAIRDDFLEYLVVGPAGAAHETLFMTPVAGSLLNLALLSLGLEPGTNAAWSPKSPQPSDDELRAGVSPYDVTPPVGDALYLYAAWREGEELFFYRVEDLVRDLRAGRSMRRHAWVYLGSRMVPDRLGEEPTLFAADLYQNLINVAFFGEGYTLLTAALPECLDQTIWMANAWLLPPSGTRVRLFFSKSRLDGLPSGPAGVAPLFEVVPEPEGR